MKRAAPDGSGSDFRQGRTCENQGLTFVDQARSGKAGGDGLRVLIVRIGAMGDVLHGLPAVAGLKRALPGCRVGWAVEPRWASLLAGADGSGPLVDRVHPVNTKKWAAHPAAFATGTEVIALRRDLRAAGYDVCVDLQGAIKSAIVARMAGATRLVGMDRPREALARSLYGMRVVCTAEHVIGQACELVSAGVGEPIEPAPVELPVEADAEGWCTAALARLGVQEKYVLLAPGAGWGAKQWGAERYGEFARKMRDAGFGVLVNGAPGGPDAELAETVAKAGGGHRLSSSVAQMVALTRRADLVIGGDTGPVHLAAALGRPTLALFGPTDPRRNGPDFPGARTVVLRDPGSVTSHKRVSATEAGLARIGVDEAWAAACTLLGGCRG